MNPEREQIVLGKAKEDLTAFEEIYDYYFPKVYAYVHYRVTNIQDAEDLTATIFLKTAEKLSDFQWRGNGSFAAWIFNIAYRIIIDFHRKKGHPSEPIETPYQDEIITNKHIPDDIALHNEQFSTLRRLISTLSPRRQEVLTLKFYGGLRNNEIARILELDERTIASHLCRGLEDLHERYLAQYINSE